MGEQIRINHMKIKVALYSLITRSKLRLQIVGGGKIRFYANKVPTFPLANERN
jgi:hypothetical protein